MMNTMLKMNPKILGAIALVLVAVESGAMVVHCGTHLSAVDGESVQVNERLLLSNLKSLEASGPADLSLIRAREEAVFCSMRGIELRTGLNHVDGGPPCH